MVAATEVVLLEKSAKISSVEMQSDRAPDEHPASFEANLNPDEKQYGIKSDSVESKTLAASTASKSESESGILWNNTEMNSLTTTSLAGEHLSLHVVIGDDATISLPSVNTERLTKTKGELRKQLQIKMAEREDSRNGSPSPQLSLIPATVAQQQTVASKNIVEKVNFIVAY